MFLLWVLGLLNICMLLGFFFLTSHMNTSINSSNGRGRVEFLDLLFFFSPHAAYQNATEIGSAGRLLYLNYWAWMDSVFPLSLSLFLHLGLKKNGKSLDPLILALPLLAALADFVENYCITSIYSAYPQRNDALAVLGGRMNAVKNSLFSASLLLWLLTTLSSSSSQHHKSNKESSLHHNTNKAKNI